MSISTIQRLPVTVQVKDAAGNLITASAPPTITSSDAGVAEVADVAADGLSAHVYGRSVGTADIVAHADGIDSAPLSVEVTAPPVAEVDLVAGTVETGPF